MKKLFFALFLHCALAQAGSLEKIQESLYLATLTPLASGESSPKTTIYDYLEHLKTTKQLVSQDVLLSKTKNCCVHIEPGVSSSSIKTGEPVFVFSASFMPEPIKTPGKLQFYWPGASGRTLYEAGYYCMNKTIPTACVAFDYPDTRTTLNVGQASDQHCLDMVTQQVIANGHPYILFGKCRGATTILNFITNKPQEYLREHVRAVIVETAPLSLRHICEQSMRALPVLNWFYWLSDKKATAALYALFRFVLPNHLYEETSLLQKIDAIPKDLPILVIHIINDTVVYDEDIKLLLQTLLETGHTSVHLLLYNDHNLNHYTVAKASTYAPAVNAFLQKYDLPHTETLAQQGAETVPATTVPLACPATMNAREYIQKVWQYHPVTGDGKLSPLPSNKQITVTSSSLIKLLQ